MKSKFLTSLCYSSDNLQSPVAIVAIKIGIATNLLVKSDSRLVCPNKILMAIDNSIITQARNNKWYWGDVQLKVNLSAADISFSLSNNWYFVILV